jgi:hypothetical protein
MEATDQDGAKVQMVYDMESPVNGDLISFRHIFTSPTWDRPQISRSTLRFIGRDALSSFLSNAGLEIETQYGNWDGQSLSDTSPEIITIARRS